LRQINPGQLISRKAAPGVTAVDDQVTVGARPDAQARPLPGPLPSGRPTSKVTLTSSLMWIKGASHFPQQAFPTH